MIINLSNCTNVSNTLNRINQAIGNKMEITVSEVRKNLSDIISEVAFGKKRFVINRRGKKLVAIIPLEDLEQLERNKAS